MTGNICYLGVCFLHRDQLNSRTSLYKELCVTTGEIAAYTKASLSWDTWHAHMGHPGGESVKWLPLVATGFTLDSKKQLGKCEACIVSKHPRKPYPPSETHRAKKMLDLVHSDLCGPFPV